MGQPLRRGSPDNTKKPFLPLRLCPALVAVPFQGALLSGVTLFLSSCPNREGITSSTWAGMDSLEQQGPARTEDSAQAHACGLERTELSYPRPGSAPRRECLAVQRNEPRFPQSALPVSSSCLASFQFICKQIHLREWSGTQPCTHSSAALGPSKQ